jgi:hypothetical protein
MKLPNYKNNLPGNQTKHYNELAISERKRIISHIKRLNREDLVEEIKVYDEWFKDVENIPIEPRFVLLELLNVNDSSEVANYYKKSLEEKTGILYSRLDSIFNGCTLTVDECRRLLFAYSSIDWKKLVDDFNNWRGCTPLLDIEENPCNNCGDTIHKQYGLINISYTGGYFSDHLIDLHEYKFSLCEKCLKLLFCNFHIPPKVTRL